MVRLKSATRVPLNWKRPPEWGTFLDTVEDRHGATSPYAGFAIERAWREYDNRHRSEDLADRLLDAVGSGATNTREKNSPRRSVGTGDGRTTVRVRSSIKEDMADYATECDVPKYEVLRSVVCWYLDGGLVGLLTEKLETAVPEADRLLSDLEASTGETIGAVDRRTVKLCRRLTGAGEEFHRDDFRDALADIEGVSDSEYCRDEYLPRILDRLNYEQHPNVSDVFLPAELARQYADNPDAPAVDRKPYGDLSTDERVEGIQIELAREANRRGRRTHAFRADDVRNVFDGTPSKRKARDLMDKAARADGFGTDAKGGGKRLRVNLADAPADIMEFVDDGSGETDESDDAAADFEDRMDTLEQATYET